MIKLRSAYKRVLLAVAAVSALVFSGLYGLAAYPISGASTGFTDELNNALTTALPIGAGVVALFVGWKIFKRMSHG